MVTTFNIDETQYLNRCSIQELLYNSDLQLGPEYGRN